MRTATTVMQMVPATARLVWLARQLAATAGLKVQAGVLRATARLKAQVVARLGLRVKLRP